jgi:hypothetical protein
MRRRFSGSLAALRGASGLPHALITLTAASRSGILRTSIRCEVSKPQFNGSPVRARLMLRSCYVETNMLRIRFPSRRSLAALKKVSGAHVTVGLIIAAVFFAVACAVETRAILALESSPNPLEDPPDHGQNVYQ